ncbi:hypothetical protein [Acidianus brierleyi]|uniref:Uncharacterized protein n=1 Tax=Acidianus brierleyi TaxID=41673 RepID=A0A2U9IBZ5_9CREN|nr:hypothetical protein [Acidianus brierleyi]AWR93532.1 hypothetical protein DFR85_01790 [Acidianus brierleyi]
MIHSLQHFIILLVSLIIAWIIISFPIWISAKFFNSSASLGKAMIATIAGLIVFYILSAIFGLILPFPIPQIIGFLGILWVFKNIFNVGWGGAFGIAILAAIIIIIINLVIIVLFNISIPFI